MIESLLYSLCFESLCGVMLFECLRDIVAVTNALLKNYLLYLRCVGDPKMNISSIYKSDLKIVASMLSFLFSSLTIMGGASPSLDWFE